MQKPRKGQFVPYEMLTPGWEAVYTSETLPADSASGEARAADGEGNIFTRWPVWTWLGEESGWDAEVKTINKMQTRLGLLSEDIRKIRAHVGSLVPCDTSFPVTVDELLRAVGRGKLEEPALHNGCWNPLKWDRPRHGDQPRQAESMQVIEQVLRRYLAGEPSDALIADLPHAAGFIRRTYDWLGPRQNFTEIQRLLVEKMLLQFDFYTRRNPDREGVTRDACQEGGRGAQLDARIASLGGFPSNWEEPAEPGKEELRNLWGRIDGNIYGGLCDCHHSSFRWIESWICGIGASKILPIPTRKKGTERERLGRLLFGYVLALDKWLLGVPMQFLLFDLGHVDLGFDPKNEILRVYAYLGEERTPVKEWLVACLWYTLMFNRIGGNPAGLMRHERLTDRARARGVSVREWMDAALAQ